MEGKILCCTCGMAWPCNTPGGMHMSTGQLQATVQSDRKRRWEIADEFRESGRRGRR